MVEQRTENELPKLRLLTTTDQVLTEFFNSRREGLSSRTIEFYECYLYKSRQVISLSVTGQHIIFFLKHLKCSAGGKHAYYRALKAFYNWLYSPKSGHNINAQNNPILIVDPPKLQRKILPSLSPQQLDYLIEQASCIRDKAIISLFADSGLRLTELTNINPKNIDWDTRLIKVTCKGNKEGFAPLGKRTELLLKQWLTVHEDGKKLWDINHWGTSIMLRRLSQKTGLPCNPHTFRRTFARILAKRGVDSLHIKRLGRWESLAMVDRYTKSVQFEDRLKLYSDIVN